MWKLSAFMYRIEISWILICFVLILNVATVLLLDACQHVTRHLHIYRRTDTQNKSFLLHYLLNNYANYVTNNFIRVNIIQNVVFRLLRHIIASYCGVIRGGAVGRGTALQAGRSRVRFPIVSSEFFIDIILPAALWPWGQPLTGMSTRNISWGDKGGRCVGLTTLPPSCADYHEIWEPQPPGTLRACPGL